MPTRHRVPFPGTPACTAGGIRPRRLDPRGRAAPLGGGDVRRRAPTDTVVFVRNTTEAINPPLTHCLVLRSRPLGAEHRHRAPREHASLAPARRTFHLLDAPGPLRSRSTLCAAFEDRHRPIGSSPSPAQATPTGEVFPLSPRPAVSAHEHGALLSVDAAQPAPHRAIDMVDHGHDFLALSGPKMYAPFGGGALIAPPPCSAMPSRCSPAAAR